MEVHFSPGRFFRGRPEQVFFALSASALSTFKELDPATQYRQMGVLLS